MLTEAIKDSKGSDPNKKGEHHVVSPVSTI